jgi:hypothetical protein
MQEINHGEQIPSIDNITEEKKTRTAVGGAIPGVLKSKLVFNELAGCKIKGKYEEKEGKNNRVTAEPKNSCIKPAVGI